ncbi:SMI1/KNR4 family protein [Flavobacterium aestuarii]|uniref:SMI1/KNR4 family protein n=1 Tax=Flavobacterium aestuarii TaxID=3149227 RepID=UPI0032B55DD2
MLDIENIFAKYGFQKRTEKPKTTIKEVEDKINFSLPADYRFYAENYIENESFVGNEFVRLWDFNEILTINSEYQIIENLKNTIAIGGNGSSEFIAIENVKNGECRIVLSPFIDLDKTYHIEIGNSFTDFFERLEKGKNWFE